MFSLLDIKKYSTKETMNNEYLRYINGYKSPKELRKYELKRYGEYITYIKSNWE